MTLPSQTTSQPVNLLSYGQAATSLWLQPLKPTSLTSLLPLLLQKILIFPFKMIISMTFHKYWLLSWYSNLTVIQLAIDSYLNSLHTTLTPISIPHPIPSLEKRQNAVSSSVLWPFLFEPLDYCKFTVKSSDLARSLTRTIWSCQIIYLYQTSQVKVHCLLLCFTTLLHYKLAHSFHIKNFSLVTSDNPQCSDSAGLEVVCRCHIIVTMNGAFLKETSAHLS
jgi:hypothetical protein